MKKINDEIERLIRAQTTLERATAGVMLALIEGGRLSDEANAVVDEASNMRDAVIRLVMDSVKKDLVTRMRIRRAAQKAKKVTEALAVKMAEAATRHLADLPHDDDDADMPPELREVVNMARGSGLSVKVVKVEKKPQGVDSGVAPEGRCGNPKCQRCNPENAQSGSSASDTVH